MENISRWFWNDRFWFPEGCSFEDVKPNPDVVYAQPRDLLALPVFGLIVFLLRHGYERYISNPLFIKMLRYDVLLCETAHTNGYTSNSNGVNNGKAKLANGRDGLQANYFERRRRKAQKAKILLAKIAETGWKSVYHSTSFVVGVTLMRQAPWFWETRHCYSDFPKHPLWPLLYCYYMIEGAYYISLILCLSTDVKRKDREMMMVHHVGTLILIVFSYATNHTRIGSLLMILHQPADMLVQIAKLLLYCKCQRATNVLFIIFTAVFLVTRLYIFPVYIIYDVMIKFSWYYRPYAWYYLSCFICFVLQVLHCFWAYVILKMFVKIFTKGPIERDDRSGTEDDSDDDEEPVESKKQN